MTGVGVKCLNWPNYLFYLLSAKFFSHSASSKLFISLPYKKILSTISTNLFLKLGFLLTDLEVNPYNSEI